MKFTIFSALIEIIFSFIYTHRYINFKYLLPMSCLLQKREEREDRELFYIVLKAQKHKFKTKYNHNQF